MVKNTKAKKLQSIIEIVRRFSRIQDLDVLFEHILTEARKIVNADAGSVYFVVGNHLHIKYAQNDTVAKRTADGKIPYTYFSFPIDDKSMSGYVALTGKELNIEGAYKIPSDLPYSFNSGTDMVTDYRTRSVYTIPLKASTGKVIGVLQMINAQDENSQVIPFGRDAKLYLSQFVSSAAQVLEHTSLSDEMIRRMLLMASFRDPKETYRHVERVSRFSVEIYDRWAQNHSVPPTERVHFRDNLRIAAKFHDIGKIGIPDMILKKTYPRLEVDERSIIMGHTCLGAKLFVKGTTETDKMSYEVTLHHHERWDGGESAYPGQVNLDDFVIGKPIPPAKHLKGKKIPLAARIVAVADVFDALSHKRSYKEAWSVEDAIEEIKKSSGSHFDPEVVDAFLQVQDRILSIYRLHPDED
ncbi:HD domain-containing phosphohydrolase [Treponema parvum]|uniref:HD domain-containing phosphohydrolase n=1 Tax=Treponema parvum TaxID=138851 RepID=UPI001AEC62F1|nr:HD domain-containing phosphohydrolase [Treponema parvum]QTQ16629.1 HD domain-containing protein [Treponema parvum]